MVIEVLVPGDDRPVRPGVLPALQDRHRIGTHLTIIALRSDSGRNRHRRRADVTDHLAPVPAALTLKGVTLT